MRAPIRLGTSVVLGRGNGGKAVYTGAAAPRNSLCASLRLFLFFFSRKLTSRDGTSGIQVACKSLGR